MKVLFRGNPSEQFSTEAIESTVEFESLCLDTIITLAQETKSLDEAHKIEDNVSDIIELCGTLLKSKGISTKHFFNALEQKVRTTGRFNDKFSTSVDSESI